MRFILFFISVVIISFSSFSENIYEGTQDNSSLYTRMMDLEARLREVQGKLQQIEYTNKQLIAKIGNVVDDMNYRFAKLEKSPSDTESIKDLKEHVKMFLDGKVEEALKELNNYVKHAKDDEKGEVYYWIGRAYMEQKIYKEAGTYFLKSYKYYPANPRAASSLLYLAMSLEKIDKVNRACSILERLDL